jgi:hypothetical protein
LTIFREPNLPNGVVNNDIEHILLFSKPAGHRKLDPKMRLPLRIETDD